MKNTILTFALISALKHYAKLRSKLPLGGVKERFHFRRCSRFFVPTMRHETTIPIAIGLACAR